MHPPEQVFSMLCFKLKVSTTYVIIVVIRQSLFIVDINRIYNSSFLLSIVILKYCLIHVLILLTFRVMSSQQHCVYCFLEMVDPESEQEGMDHFPTYTSSMMTHVRFLILLPSFLFSYLRQCLMFIVYDLAYLFNLILCEALG